LKLKDKDFSYLLRAVCFQGRKHGNKEKRWRLYKTRQRFATNEQIFGFKLSSHNTSDLRRKFYFYN